VFLPGLVRQFHVAAPPATLAVLYLGVFPAAIAYVLWNYALARMPASLLSSFLYLSPVLASIIAWVWLGEVPALLTILGGAVAILGVILVQTKGQQTRLSS
jgi:drug/metabolite transporter (DMT)-like permease